MVLHACEGAVRVEFQYRVGSVEEKRSALVVSQVPPGAHAWSGLGLGSG